MGPGTSKRFSFTSFRSKDSSDPEGILKILHDIYNDIVVDILGYTDILKYILQSPLCPFLALLPFSHTFALCLFDAPQVLSDSPDSASGASPKEVTWSSGSLLVSSSSCQANFDELELELQDSDQADVQPIRFGRNIDHLHHRFWGLELATAQMGRKRSHKELRTTSSASLPLG